MCNVLIMGGNIRTKIYESYKYYSFGTESHSTRIVTGFPVAKPTRAGGNSATGESKYIIYQEM